MPFEVVGVNESLNVAELDDRGGRFDAVEEASDDGNCIEARLAVCRLGPWRVSISHFPKAGEHTASCSSSLLLPKSCHRGLRDRLASTLCARETMP